MNVNERRYRKISWAVLAAVLISSAFWMYQVSLMQFDYDFEKFFPQNDPETTFFNEHRDRFGTDNDFILIAIENEEGVFQADFLQQIERFTADLKSVPHAEEVASPTDLQYTFLAPITNLPISNNYIHTDQPEIYAKDSARIWESPDIRMNFFSADGSALAVLIRHTPYLSKEKCDTLAEAVYGVIEDYDFDDIHLTGRAIAQSYYVTLMMEEMAIFVTASFFLVLLFLYIAFRTGWGVWVPVLVVMLSVVWILGLMSITGKGVDVMLTVLPTIMFVVGMSDVVHILSKYIEELRAGQPKLVAVRKAFKEVGTATFLTSLTTAIGFFTLLSSNVTPIADFGLYTGIGVFIAFGLTFTVLPSMMVLTKKPKIAARTKSSELFWYRNLHRWLLWTLKNRRAIGIGAIVLVVVCVYAISQIRINNYLLEDLGEENELKQEFNYFDERFGGVRPYELSLTLNDSSTWADYKNLVLVDTVDKWLQQNMGTGFSVSPLSFVKHLNRMQAIGTENYKLPDSEQRYNKRLYKQVRTFLRTDTASMFVTKGLDTMRLSTRMSDIGSLVIRDREKEFTAFMEALGAGDWFAYRITGTARLIDLNNEQLAENMLIGLLIAFGVIALIVGLLFRSFKMVILALIPNMFPLLVVAAVMGFSGISLKVSTSIIFTIIFGIAVDDTIHFLSKLRFESLQGKRLFYAIKRTYLSTGRAIVVTTIILSGGFLMLIFSDFMGTFYIGFLLGMALILAVIADLMLLPLLLIWFYGKDVQLLEGKVEAEKGKG